MLRSPISQRQCSHVTVRFGDGAHSFALAKDATLNELADRVLGLGAQHDGAPLAVHVVFKSNNSRSTMPQSSSQHVAS